MTGRKISPREFYERMKGMRKRSPKPELVDQFNKIDEKHERDKRKPAEKIAETTCLGLSDAMIINAFRCSRFPFIVSSDFDIGYAVLASRELKDVVMPDSVAKKYRDYHFDGR